MPVRLCLAVLALIGLGSLAFTSVSREAAAARDATVHEFSRDMLFERTIKPLLAEHCLACHGPDKAEGGLNLVDRKQALKQLESGLFGIVPGKPEESELIRRVSSHDESERMPPEGKPLKPAEIEALRRWISLGAEYQQHWAYRKLEKPTPPTVKIAATNAAAIRNPIDSFVLAKLEAQKIAPSPEASRETQIKRLYFDLLGLLPKPEEVQAFVADKSPDAYEKLVDRLLASPHFGERWGRHWLDMARYADSDGYEKDRARPDAYVYRDWVINAYNANMPFDQFTIEQLAGDLLPGATPSQRIATAFNRQTLTNEEGGVDQEEYRVNAVFDRTDTLGAVWLGLTLGCAKCHNHKYDEISQAEYYQMFAFFNDADEVLERIPVKATDAAALEKKLLPLETALAKRKRELAKQQAAWEKEQRDLIESQPNLPLKVVDLDGVEVAAAGGTKLVREKKNANVFVATVKEADGKLVKLPAVETFTVTIGKPPAELTGFRLDVFPHPDTKDKSVGLGTSGNFVLTQFKAQVVDAAGKVLREVPLQRAAADFQQPNYAAAMALTAATGSKKGWAVKPEATKPHYLNVRTTAPFTLAAGERLQVVLDQQYGGSHYFGRFQLRGLTGDARELHLPPEIVTALKMYPEKRVAATRTLLFNHYAAQEEQMTKLQAEIDATLRQFKAEMMPVRMISTALNPRKTHRFERGDFLSPADEQKPGLLQVLPQPKTTEVQQSKEKPGVAKLTSQRSEDSVFQFTAADKADGKAKKPAPSAEAETAESRRSRLDLARWLVSVENPLTPRVVANQIWYRLFGAGIVRSVGDFGARGELPSHPELLDWLAATYQRDLKWNTKAFIKTILMSATYRQASTHRTELVEIDPLNTLLARQNRLRVEGEVVRDLALASAGLLNPKIGGPSVFPPMPPELAKLSYANSFSWTDSKGDDRYRRGMYTFFKRTMPHPTLMTFDCPDANVTCVNRTVSNTPLQALTLLNNESFVEASQALAKRLLTEDVVDAAAAKSQAVDNARLSAAVWNCLARKPRTDELDRLDNLLENAREYYKDHPEEAEQMIGRFAVPTVADAEAAAWTATVRVLLNLDEFITRE
ncbi:MAG: PSD1 domain-containing protein [Planctomycetaceae bacterium]|nr:PSD1 domain-containing protein [Planctomycetaceae bacterium]